MVLQQIPGIRRASDWFRLFGPASVTIIRCSAARAGRRRVHDVAHASVAPPHFSRRHVVRCDRSSSRRMRDSGIESEAETDAFHARVINAWGEDAD
ncbi:hypothetical protein RI054_24g103270 [Pseudoscourfieldia marina]